MTWRNWLDKGKCLVGLHQGEWSFVSEKECTRVRVCTRCGAENRKVEHNWSAWAYARDEDCDQQQLCQRCSLAEHRVVHQWEEPQRKSSDSCDQVQICARCGGEQDAAPSHEWARWEYVSPDACPQTQVCERCSSPGGQRRIEHQWGEWQHSEQHGGPVRVCRRCGEFSISKQAQVTPASGEVQSVAAPKPVSTAGVRVDRDPQLVGHWRFTDLGPRGGGFSQVKDYHRVLGGDGSFADYNHTAGTLGESWSEREVGQWRTEGNILHMEHADGSEWTYEYRLVNGTLVFGAAPRQQLWERVG